MTQVNFGLPSKAIVLFYLFLFITIEVAWTQCNNPVPTGDNAQTFCKIDAPTLMDIAVTGGTIQWYDAPSGGGQYFNTQQLEDGKTYYAEDVTNGDCSPSRLAVTVTLNGQEPDNVDVFVGKCAIEYATISQLSADGQNIEWYTESTGGTLLDPSHLLENGQTYWVQQTYGGCTSRRLPTTVSLIDAPAPTVDAVQNFCTLSVTTVADLSPSGSNIIWYNSETSTDPLDVTEPLIHGEDYWAATLSFPCESTVRTQTTVFMETPPEAGNNGVWEFCEQDTVVENLFDFLTGTPDTTGTWTGPSALSNGYLGTFDSATNIEGVYTYTVSTGTGICPDTSATVTVTIQRTPAPVVSDINQTYCEIDMPTVADLVATGASLVWFDTETSTTPLNNTDPLIDGEDYWAAQVGNGGLGCLSGIRAMVNVTIVSVPAPTVSNANQSFCSIDNPTIADLAATGTNIGWYDTEFSTTPLNNADPLIDGEDYWAAEMGANGCLSMTRVVVNATVIDVAPPTTANPNQAFCVVDQPTIADLQVNEATVVWYDSENGTTPLNNTDALIDGEDYWAALQANGCESPNRLEITVTLNDIAPPTTPNSAQTFCEIDNATIADLAITGTNVVWFDTETSTTPLNPADALVDGEDYWAAQTDGASGCLSSIRTVVTATITVVPPPSVSNVNQAFCAIDTPTIADLAITGTTIAWFDTELSTTPLNSADALVDGEDYWAAEIGANGCLSATRVVVNATVIDVAPPTTANTNQAFCVIDQPTIADLQVNETTIVWYDSENGTTPLNSTDALIDGEDYWAALQANGCESPNRLEITVSLNDIAAPTTSNSAQTFCELDNATIADLDITGTNVVWFDAETSTTPLNPADALIDGEDYWAAQTDGASGCISSVRTVVTATITVVPPPTVSNANQAFCSIDNPTIADLAATGTNIVWFDTELATTALNSTDALIDGEDYWAAETGANGCLSMTRVVVNVTVIDVAPPTTANANQVFCAVDQPTVADLQVNEVNIVWYDSENGANTVTTDTALVDGNSYWAALQANGCESPNRLEIIVTLNDIAAPTTPNSAQTFCELDNATIADLAITGTNVVWFDTETSTTPLNVADALVDGEDYWAAQTDGASGCLSAVRTVVNVTITVVPPPTVSNANQAFCTIDNPTIADLAATGTNVVWFDTELATTPLNNTDALVDGEDYWAAEMGANGCLSITRVVVNATVIDVAPPTTANPNQAFCVVDQPTIANLQVNETSIVWYDSENGSNILATDTALVDGNSYWAALQANGCESPNRLEIVVTLNDIAAPTTSEPAQSFCGSDNATLNDLNTNEANIIWYASETSSTALSATDLVVDGTTYWAAQLDTVSGCESSTRLAIAVTVIPSIPPTTLDSTQSFCLVNNPVVGDLQSNEMEVYWYANATDTTPLDASESLVNGAIYYGSFFDAPSPCEGPTRLEVTVVINDPAAPTTSNTTMTFCTADAPTVAMLSVNESNAVWFSSETETTPLADDTLLTDGGAYWAAIHDTATGCLGSSRLMITVNLTDPGTPTISAQGTEFCMIDEPTISDLEGRISGGSGNTISILDAPDGFELSPGELLVDGATYYAIAKTSAGCISTTALAITVDLSKCDMYDVKFFDGFSPNGDGVNEVYNIQNMRELYPDFEVTFFNRWGSEVYHMDASTPSWNGRLHGDGALVPSGVYFYVAKFNKDGRKPVQGKLILNR